MPFATWWRGDPLPELPPLPGLTVRRSLNRALINQMTGLTRPAIEGRIKADNAFFAALLDREPTAYGWVALHEGRIDELAFRFTVPPGNAYLWDFETLPAWRGRGIYPRLLQGITAQLSGVDRFWIGYDAGNTASARGIEKAGFVVVGDLAIVDGRATGFEPLPGHAADDVRTAAARDTLRPTVPQAQQASGGVSGQGAPATSDADGAP